MEKHTRHFNELKEKFDNLQNPANNSEEEMDRIAWRFSFDLVAITTCFDRGKMIVNAEELNIVQGWISKILTNDKISEEVRSFIADENVGLTSMVEKINNSTSYTTGC